MDWIFWQYIHGLDFWAVYCIYQYIEKNSILLNSCLNEAFWRNNDNNYLEKWKRGGLATREFILAAIIIDVQRICKVHCFFHPSTPTTTTPTPHSLSHPLQLEGIWWSKIVGASPNAKRWGDPPKCFGDPLAHPPTHTYHHPKYAFLGKNSTQNQVHPLRTRPPPSAKCCVWGSIGHAKIQ